MTDGILVNHDSLDSMIAEMQHHVAAMRGRVDQLMRDLSPLQDQFLGEAKSAHTEVQTKVNRHFDWLGAVLSDTAVAVRNAQAHYADADAKGAQQFYSVLL